MTPPENPLRVASTSGLATIRHGPPAASARNAYVGGTRGIRSPARTILVTVRPGHQTRFWAGRVGKGRLGRAAAPFARGFPCVSSWATQTRSASEGRKRHNSAVRPRSLVRRVRGDIPPPMASRFQDAEKTCAAAWLTWRTPTCNEALPCRRIPRDAVTRPALHHLRHAGRGYGRHRGRGVPGVFFGRQADR